ncbi:hypothetical protein [Nocardia sp. NPDC004750]
MPDLNPVPIPRIPGIGYARLIAARMRGEIAARGLPLAELEAATDIEPSEFAEYFDGVKAWTLDDIERVASALGIEVWALLEIGPAPTLLTLTQLLLWVRKHYGKAVSLAEVIDSLYDAADLPAHDQWVRFVAVCDSTAIAAARASSEGTQN